MTTAKKLHPPADGESILRLENQLCFALYAATRAMTRTYREKLQPLGITYPQYLVLIVLWETDAIGVSEIGHKLMLDSGTLTPVLKRLEQQGVLKRKRSSADEREVVVTLTAKGRDLKTKALDARRFVACRLGMSEPEIRALRNDLMELVEGLQPGTGLSDP